MLRWTMFGYDLLGMNEATIIVRLLLSMLCGAVLGIERSRKRRAAGMRTFILICCSSCLIMLISQFLNVYYEGGTDLGRMGAQVVSGIGFVCTGTILLTGKHRVTGLTTAASLWSVASIGLAIGAGLYFGAILSTGILLFAMFVLDGYQSRVGTHTSVLHLYCIAKDKSSVGIAIESFRDRGFSVSELSSASSDLIDGIAFVVLLRSEVRFERNRMIDDLHRIEGMIYVDEI